MFYHHKSCTRRLGRTCIHKVGQYYVKPGQIQTVTVVGKEDDQEQTLNEGEGEERSGNEEGLEGKKVTKNPGEIQMVGTEEEKEDVEELLNEGEGEERSANEEEEVIEEESKRNLDRSSL